MTWKKILRILKVLEAIFIAAACTFITLIGIVVLGIKWEWFGNHLLDFVIWLGL